MLGRGREGGIGLVEVIVSTAVAALLITTLFTFIVRSFTPPRQQYEQGRITEEARIQLNRVSDMIRGGADIDFTGNGKFDVVVPQETWLQYGGANEIIFYTRRDTGGNDRLEEVRLWLNNTDLNMEVKTMASGACFATNEVLTVARSVRNLADNTPLFSYFLNAGVELSTPVAIPNNVKRVRITLLVDSDLQQKPDAAVIRTEIKPRRGLESVTYAGNPPQCGDCVDNDLDGTVDVGGTPNTIADPGCSTASDTSEKGNSPECDDAFDNEGDLTIDFRLFGDGDLDCTSPSGTSEGVPAVPANECEDTIDNDSDGLIDFGQDPGCVSSTDNDEINGSNECQDGIDNDGDGATDHPADFSCATPTDNNETNAQSKCQDGNDNDNDGAIDFPDDFSCASLQDNDEDNPKAQCQNGIDDDGDGLVDYPSDPNCTSKQDNAEKAAVCSNGFDDDFDGVADFPADFSCSSADDFDEFSPQAHCQDDSDNDGDGVADFPADFSCASKQDNDEANPKAQCQNGIDNDGDGATDHPADFSCVSKQDNDETNLKALCQDGIDNDSDGYTDYPADPTCTSLQHNIEAASSIVFVTASSSGASYGGLTGADAICQAEAGAAGLPLPNTFKAILSDSSTNAKDRLNLTGPIRRVDNAVVAATAADLWDGSINVPINLMASGAAVPAFTYTRTGTDASGVKDAGANVPPGWNPQYPPFCANWTSTFYKSEGGWTAATNGEWISINGYNSVSIAPGCNSYFLIRLYCVGPA